MANGMFYATDIRGLNAVSNMTNYIIKNRLSELLWDAYLISDILYDIDEEQNTDNC